MLRSAAIAFFVCATAARMNYRHAFHAGNFADVVKHIVLTRILLYLHDKPTAFRVIDTHAGCGRYDLTGEEAQRSGEWRLGIAKLLAANADAASAELIKPYLDIVRSHNAGAELTVYPGSPLIARALLRPQDRMTACELEAGTHRQLLASLRHDQQARVVKIDGWTALPAYVPPQERRGVVLVDPSVRADRRVRSPRGRLRGRVCEMADRYLHALVSAEGCSRGVAVWGCGLRTRCWPHIVRKAAHRAKTLPSGFCGSSSRPAA